jgi:hypothetical protein
MRVTSTSAPRSLDASLRFAIANKRLVEIRYGGKIRIAEPHDYGARKGGEKLLVYQLRASGGSSRRGVIGWRSLDVPKIEACRVLDETFAGSRGSAHHDHYTWDVLYIRVS